MKRVPYKTDQNNPEVKKYVEAMKKANEILNQYPEDMRNRKIIIAGRYFITDDKGKFTEVERFE